jgi:aryl-alcohol dehydrogenase-like predicted oxidoreductase
MKFRAIPNTDLLVSETALALSPALPDEAAAEQLLRLAYDEGINLYIVSPRAHPTDRAFAAAFSGDRRYKVHWALRVAWTSDTARLAQMLEDRLLSLGTESMELVVLHGVSRADLRSGAVGDGVHRLRASGRAAHVALHAGEVDPFDDARLIERSGVALVEDEATARLFSVDDRRPPLLVHAPRFEGEEALSFLWDGAGRTPAQAGVQMALAKPGVCSALIQPLSALELKELARASLAPPLSPEEVAAARPAFAGRASAQAVGA